MTTGTSPNGSSEHTADGAPDTPHNAEG